LPVSGIVKVLNIVREPGATGASATNWNVRSSISSHTVEVLRNMMLDQECNEELTCK
jgi:hypothetical protein